MNKSEIYRLGRVIGLPHINEILMDKIIREAKILPSSPGTIITENLTYPQQVLKSYQQIVNIIYSKKSGKIKLLHFPDFEDELFDWDKPKNLEDDDIILLLIHGMGLEQFKKPQLVWPRFISFMRKRSMFYTVIHFEVTVKEFLKKVLVADLSKVMEPVKAIAIANAIKGICDNEQAEEN